MGELLDNSCSPIYGPGQKQHVRWGLDLTASQSTEQGFDLPEWKTLYIINRYHLHSLMDDEDPIGNQGDNANTINLLSDKLGEKVYDVPSNLAFEVKTSKTFRQYLWALNCVVKSLGRLHYWGDVNPVDVHDALAHAWKVSKWVGYYYSCVSIYYNSNSLMDILQRGNTGHLSIKDTWSLGLFFSAQWLPNSEPKCVQRL